MSGATRNPLPRFLRERYATPASSPVGETCRVLRLPADEAIRAAVNEVLFWLAQPEAWFVDGGISTEETSDLIDEMLNNYFVEECALGDYVVLQPLTLTVGGEGSIFFPTIDQSFSTLKVWLRIRATSATFLNGLRCVVNGNATPANYWSYSKVFENGAVVAELARNGTVAGLDISSGVPGTSNHATSWATHEITFQNYSFSGLAKPFSAVSQVRYGASATAMRMMHTAGEFLVTTGGITQLAFGPDAALSLAANCYGMMAGIGERP